uniref:Uncharacterized protein n=1 Tax=Setaria italica TaxID=4555 RepID=K3YLF6_SETIT
MATVSSILQENEVDAPLVSLSGKQISCGPSTSKPILGADAPQVSNLPKAPAVGKHKLPSKLLTFIVLHYSEVQRAKKRIADRQANRQANVQLNSVKLKAKELKQEIDSLDACLSSDAQCLKALKTERDQLILELDWVNEAIAEAQGQLNDYPIAIQEKKKELAASINQVCRQHQQVNDILGSEEEDLQLIADVDQIHLRAVQAIERAL